MSKESRCEAVEEVLRGKKLPESAKWLLLYAEAREVLCSCNKTDTPEKGPEYDYTCEWCEEHPGGNWDAVEAALRAEAPRQTRTDPDYCSECDDFHAIGEMHTPEGNQDRRNRAKLRQAGSPQQIGESPRPLDGKFGISADRRIVNLVSGEVIPEDEPLFLFRGRDWHARQTLRAYLSEVRQDCNELHIAGSIDRLARFVKFAEEHPERMKQPGITKHLKLEAEPSDSEAPQQIGESPE